MEIVSPEQVTASYGVTSVTNSVFVRASNSTEPRGERYLRSSGARSAALA